VLHSPCSHSKRSSGITNQATGDAPLARRQLWQKQVLLDSGGPLVR
jgi:hypothetical protein